MIDFLLVPTTPTTYTIAEVEADPINLNSRLGIYTNFVNLLGLCGVAIPNGFLNNGLPQGITLLASEFREGYLSAIGKTYHQTLDRALGGTKTTLRDIAV
jgi:allophanate hydrolase